MPRKPPVDECDPVGVGDIAQRTGASVHTVRAWTHQRPDFPPPAGTINGERWWHWRDVQAYCKANDLPRRR